MKRVAAGIIAAFAVMVLAGCSAPAPQATVTVPAPATTVTVLDVPPSATPSQTVSAEDKQKLFITFARSGDHPEIDKQSDASLVRMAKKVCSELAEGKEFNIAAINAIYLTISDPDSIALIAGSGAATFCPEYVPNS